MKNDQIKSFVVALLILGAALTRLIPHPGNFTAIGALAVFAAFTLSNRFLAILLPLVAMWISDLLLNNIVYPSHGFVFFSAGAGWIYAGVAAHTGIAWALSGYGKTTGITGASVAGALVFFLLSNFGVWVGSNMYAHTPEGLLQCYVAGIPFFGNFLAGTFFFAVLLFGSYFLLEKKVRVQQMA